jgi:hypothetical protein
MARTVLWEELLPEDFWHRFDLATRRYWTGTFQEYCERKCFQFPGWEALGE